MEGYLLSLYCPWSPPQPAGEASASKVAGLGSIPASAAEICPGPVEEEVAPDRGTTSSSAFPAISLGFTISGEIFVNLCMWSFFVLVVVGFCCVFVFFSPTFELVTFRLRGSG